MKNPSRNVAKIYPHTKFVTNGYINDKRHTDIIPQITLYES